MPLLSTTTTDQSSSTGMISIKLVKAIWFFLYYGLITAWKSFKTWPGNTFYQLGLEILETSPAILNKNV